MSKIRPLAKHPFSESDKEDVAIILLTYNSVSKLGGGYFDRVLQSLLSQDYHTLKLMIVDNNSEDDTVEYVRKRFASNFIFLKLNKNLGWAGGNNSGAIRFKHSSFLFFMNDDVILDSDCVTQLVRFMREQKDVGAVQPLIENRNGSLNCGANLSVSGLPQPVTCPPRRHWFEVFYASGAAMFVRTFSFFEVGMFDEDLFLWRDDVDLCWRLRIAGYKVACFADVKAFHYVSATLGANNPILSYYFVRNNIWLLTRYSSFVNFSLKFSVFAGEVFVGIIGSLLSRNYKEAVGLIKGALDGLKGLGKVACKKIRVRRIGESDLNKMLKKNIDTKALFPFLVE